MLHNRNTLHGMTFDLFVIIEVLIRTSLVLITQTVLIGLV